MNNLNSGDYVRQTKGSPQWGLSTHFFAYQPLDGQALTNIRAAGFGVIELWGMRPHFNCHDRAAVENLKQKAGELGLDISSVHAPFYTNIEELMKRNMLSLADPDTTRRSVAVAQVEDILWAAEALGARFLVLHPGTPGEDENRIGYLAQSLDELLPKARKHNLRLALENLDPPYTTDRLLELVKNYDPEWVGICLDVGHANLVGDPEETVLSVAERLFSIHLSDNDGVQDEHKCPPLGNIDWKNVLTTLGKAGFRWPYMLELRGLPELKLENIFMNMAKIYNTEEDPPSK